jgi:hypothetical protein
VTSDRLLPTSLCADPLPGWTAVGRTLTSDGAAVLLFFAWVPAILLLDRGADIWFQRLLGLVTWLLLLVFLRRESALVRAQVAVVIAFATLVEYIFSEHLEVYVYRLDNVPSFVPPGHGLVYLGALVFGRLPYVVRNQRRLATVTIVVMGAYAGWGWLLAERSDGLGAFWFFCLVGFLRWGRSVGLYIGAALVVTYLELIGTWLGNWEWSTVDPTGLIGIGNPPSGAAGGYGWFDLAAVLAAPALLTQVRGLRHSSLGRRIT